MGCTMQEEYGDPLIASNVDQEHVCAHLIELVRNTADVLEVYSTRQGDPIQRLLDRTGLFNIPKPMSAYSVMKTGADSFDDFLRGYSRKFRSNLKQQRKRLETLGVLRFELPDDIESSSETVDWLLDVKRNWVKRQQKKCPWLEQGATRDFFVAASMLRGDLGRLGLFRLTLDGKPVAAFLTTIDRTRIELLVTTFDPNYGRFSPGMLLIEDVVRWGFAHGLSFDMRPLWLEYKERWANGTTAVISYRVPLSLKGAIRLFPEYTEFRFKNFVRSVLNQGQRDAVKHVFKWPLGLKERIQSYLAQPRVKPALDE